MSNIYHLEPPTKGKVVIHTNYGDLDVELWSKETPMTCRNFIQLAMEGYYEGTIFHRLIRGFMIQGGDPTGTGQGGESVYGAPFKDEIHTRLKFTHRGLLAMANPNTPNCNGSQFFITFAECEHLRGKHTIFGKITGDTIYNLVRIEEIPTDSDDRPLDAIKILGIEVLADPFGDIVPRDISAALKLRRVQAVEETEEQKREAKRKARLERAAKKDLKLLSFGQEEEDGEGEEASVLLKPGKLKSSHDVIKDDPSLRPEVDEALLKAAQEKDEETREERAAARLKQQMTDAKDRAGDGKGGGVVSLDGADDEARAFAERMRQQMARKRKLGGGPAGPREASKVGKMDETAASMQSYEEDLEAAKKAEQAKLIREKAEEYQRLKAQMLSSNRATIVETGEAAKKRKEEKAFHEMMTPLELRRQKYLERKRTGASREDDTMARLAQFRSALTTKKKEVSGKEPEKEKEVEAYHGQVTEKDILDDDDDDGDDAAWFAGKLKFKRHIDDAFRASDGRSAEDYVVVYSKSGQADKKGRR